MRRPPKLASTFARSGMRQGVLKISYNRGARLMVRLRGGNGSLTADGLARSWKVITAWAISRQHLVTDGRLHRQHALPDRSDPCSAACERNPAACAQGRPVMGWTAAQAQHQAAHPAAGDRPRWLQVMGSAAAGLDPPRHVGSHRGASGRRWCMPLHNVHHPEHAC